MAKPAPKDAKAASAEASSELKVAIPVSGRDLVTSVAAPASPAPAPATTGSVPVPALAGVALPPAGSAPVFAPDSFAPVLTREKEKA